jgi:hypothetical protein
MPDYTHAKIYAIRAPGTNSVYIGSTTNRYLCRRLAQHRNDYKRFKEGKEHYRWSFKLLEHEGHYIELVEKVSCSSIEELRKREGELIRTTANCINWYVAGRTTAEYQKEHEEELKVYRANWYENKQREKALISSDKSPQTHSHPDQEQESSGHT